MLKMNITFKVILDVYAKKFDRCDTLIAPPSTGILE